MTVWFVTGTSSGFGLEIARQALGRGDAVVATARRPQLALDALGGEHERLLVAPLDVRSEEESRAAVDAAVARFGRIDVLVNNAGRGLFGAVEQTTPADAGALFDTNVLGVLAVTRAALPVMRAQRSGRIVLMSSMGGFASGAGFGVYAASKAAVEAMGEALAEELAPFGIAVTIVQPGVFGTGFAVSSSEMASDVIDDYVVAAEAVDRYDDGEPPGDPADLAAAVIGLADAPEPPLRLPVGADAVGRIRAKAEAVLAGLRA
ncbi:SDR family oxidoreductase [Pseudonocardia sp. CA-107938]|uniref:SDR family oxidoreductase n=1 Tax=Pseudonocardia sp. CA-107938 TaxID=3240021 RepID=UPI003D8D387B